MGDGAGRLLYGAGDGAGRAVLGPRAGGGLGRQVEAAPALPTASRPRLMSGERGGGGSHCDHSDNFIKSCAA